MMKAEYVLLYTIVLTLGFTEQILRLIFDIIFNVGQSRTLNVNT